MDSNIGWHAAVLNRKKHIVNMAGLRLVCSLLFCALTPVNSDFVIEGLRKIQVNLSSFSGKWKIRFRVDMPMLSNWVGDYGHIFHSLLVWQMILPTL